MAKLDIEHTAESRAKPESVWERYTDVEEWREWSKGVEESTLPVALGRDEQPTLEFSHVISGVIGSGDHALALTSLRRHDQSRVPSLGQAFRPVSSVL